MKRSYVVLKEMSTKRGLDVGSDPSFDLVEEIVAAKNEATELSQMGGVKAVAPSFPLRLHKDADGVSTNGTGGPPDIGTSPSEATWGVSAVGADASPFTGSGITVAIIDSGIDKNHEAFKDVELTARNFAGGQAADENGHGTHCAGTVLGRPVDGRRIGVAPGIEQALIAKVTDSEGLSTSLGLAEAIQWALFKGSDIISMSIEMDFPGLVDWLMDDQGLDRRVAVSMALEDYSKNVDLFDQLAGMNSSLNAFGRGATIFAATGNSSQRRAPEPFVLGAAPPAAAKEIIGIGAVGRSVDKFGLAPFSNAGASFVAPGVGIESAGMDGGLAKRSGTSMAAPHAAGVAALWLERLRAENPGIFIDTDTLIGAMRSAADSAGLIDKSQADIGHGMITAPGASR